MSNCEINGSMPEWLMGADCKSAGYAYAGSNPARPICLCSSVVEHTLGKGEVTSSILVTGFQSSLSNCSNRGPDSVILNFSP